jgi:omega-6 fatty acid desaturase (delta-12 desaturase)
MLLDTAAAVTTSDGDAETAKVPREGSLKPVLDVLSPSVYERPTWKGMAYFLRDVALYLALAVGLVLVPNVPGALALDLVISLVVSGLFIVGHDAAHGALFSSKRLNSVVGHIAMLPGWHVYQGWVLGHNRIHHAYTVRQGYDFVWHPVTPEEFRAMSPLRRAVHRFEWSFLGAGAYYTHQIWWKRMVVGKTPARWSSPVRKDRFFVLGFVLAATAGLALLGAATTHSVAGTIWLIARVLVLPWLGFMYILGSFVHVHHVHPTIRWWKKAEWTKFKAQMEGTTVLRAPKGLNFFIHWIMVHVPHHVDMRIPMYNLEAAAAEIEAAFPGTVHEAPLRYRDFIKSSRQCKLYDFEEGRWLTYAEAR